jgi:hypothetical protein
MKYQAIEYQQLINQLRAVRYDLSEKTITEEIKKIHSRKPGSLLNILKYCIERACNNYPLPWE